TLTWGRKISLPRVLGPPGGGLSAPPGREPGGKGDSHACGIALAPDRPLAYVCLSRNNSLGVVDLEAGVLKEQIPVGVAPFDVALAADGGAAWVSNWGGRRPKPGERSAPPP